MLKTFVIAMVTLPIAFYALVSQANDAVTEDYYIDNLHIRLHVLAPDAECFSGGRHHFYLQGAIGPDSSFSIGELMKRFEPCKDRTGNVIHRNIVTMSSGGGLLDDGYKLGRIFREFDVSVRVKSKDVCASSCAVAFLGGTSRVVEDEANLLFHAPYLSGELVAGGAGAINCNVGEEALGTLGAYYAEMTNQDVGERLLDRTLSYCSSSDGWLIAGGAAAELYGIATQRHSFNLPHEQGPVETESTESHIAENQAYTMEPEYSNCVWPETPVVPLGDQATLTEMTEAQSKIKKFQGLMARYRSCTDALMLVLKQRIADGDGSFGHDLNAAALRYNESVTLEEQLAANFNAEIQLYKAYNP